MKLSYKRFLFWSGMLLGGGVLVLGTFFPELSKAGAVALLDAEHSENEVKSLAAALTKGLRYFGIALLVSNAFLYLFCRKRKTKYYLILFVMSVLISTVLVSYIITDQIS